MEGLIEEGASAEMQGGDDCMRFQGGERRKPEQEELSRRGPTE